MDPRTLVKRGIEAALVASRLPRRRIRGRASGTVLFAYHNVLPHGAGAVRGALHIPQKRFGEHLDRLVDTHDIVPLSSIAVGDSPTGRPRAVITFDDAYRGALTAGFHELARRHLPATVFVPPGLLGSAGFWWDRLAPPGRDLAVGIRDHILHSLGGRGPAALDWARRQGMPVNDLPAYARPVTRVELFAHLRRGGFELGSHTWSHVNLAAVPPDEVRREITRGHDWLEAVRSETPVVDWLAYPYGFFGPEAVAVAAARLKGALLVEGGAAEVAGRWVADAHRVPRINVPAGLGVDGLTLRLAGLR
ncbi:MAG: polysaccharide deacetylase family protein [Gemmatimonadetes bacterium]|nr:polysaccharide deacetylase family protein [Gemmatimonadota bacterium]